MDVAGLLTSLITGGVGGNLAGMLMKDKSLGMLWNTVAGVVGGGLGSQLLGMLGMASGGGLDLASIAGSTVGGGVLMAIVGFIKQMMAKSKQPA
jgi:uncharacterized membrane protein YeaQ/YmgE (transglycosylase-associated protein family)